MNGLESILTIREEGPIRFLFGEPEVDSTPPLAQPLFSEEEEALLKVHDLFFNALTKASVPREVEMKMRAVMNHLSRETKDHRNLEDSQRQFFSRVVHADAVQNFVPIATPLTVQFLFDLPYNLPTDKRKKNELLIKEVVTKVDLLDDTLQREAFCTVFQAVLDYGDFQKVAAYLDAALVRHCPYPMSSWTYQFNGIFYLGERLRPYSQNICKVTFEKEEEEGEEVAPLYTHRLFLERIEYFKERMKAVNEISLRVFAPRLLRDIIEAEVSSTKLQKLCQLPKKKEDKVRAVQKVMTAVTFLESRKVSKKFWDSFAGGFEKLKKIKGKGGHKLRLRLATESGKKFIWEQYVVGLVQAIAKSDERAIEFASKKKQFGDGYRVNLLHEMALLEEGWMVTELFEDIIKFLKPLVVEEMDPKDIQTLFLFYYRIATATYGPFGAARDAQNEFFDILQKCSIATLVPEDKRWSFFYDLEKLLKECKKGSFVGGKIVELMTKEKEFLQVEQTMSKESFPQLYDLIDDKETSSL